ncbi:MAG: class I SAM-dependent methyltransferase [Candidatus Uhrbacteria bacterium]|nr:class I SAM-dependent methyltransferase [Candidatus Uhrbacteria bacterium]
MSQYLSVVAKSGQVNTPPGSYVTVKEWAQKSFVNPSSTILEIGCSTGFITIEMARYTGAQCTGMDLHEKSVQTAKQNVDRFVADRVSFQQGDAGKLPFEDNQFSHVIVSGHLPFIPAEMRSAHIREAVRVLKPWGHLLVALYYYKSPPPLELLKEFNAKIGTCLTQDGNRSYWSCLFEDQPLSLEYASDYAVSCDDEDRTRAYIAQMNPETAKDWETYLRLFNDNGRYLQYFVQVYRKIPDESGLMLQIPRGGIYEVNKISERSF